MQAYAQILLIAMPAFLVLVLFEKFWGWYQGNDTVRVNDMISSLSSGITNVTKDVLGLSIGIISYGWLYDHLALIHIPTTLWTYLLAFVALDFAGYWGHRIAHEYNLFWNNHIIHHSSEEFNLACALRQSISNVVRIFAVFLLPAALIGIEPQVIGAVGPLHLFAQFWYHTRHIGKMGLLEHIIVTPSHHRVHHAINPVYLDKNYSEIFIFWDKLFGTFQPELPDVPCVYGVTRPVRTWNPIKINFMHLGLLIRDAWHTRNLADKFRIWFMPLGWRPTDVQNRFPVYKVEDVFTFEKYDTKESLLVKCWFAFQLLMVLMFLTYWFANIQSIGLNQMFWYGGFIFLSIYAITEQMDHNLTAPLFEGLRLAFGVLVIVVTGDWFGASAFWTGAPFLIVTYLIFSFILSILIYRSDKNSSITV
jgi:sterol desaturase/sphingolipid hydroxylase (fatty acid hydroxylase superfamily)